MVCVPQSFNLLWLDNEVYPSNILCAMHLPECLGRSISQGEKEQEKGRNAFPNTSVWSFIHFFLPSELPAAQKHVGDVLVLKAMAHSFTELFWGISPSALDSPETTDNCDRKLQGRLTYRSLLTGRSFPVPSYSWNHRAWVTCPNPQRLLTLLQSKHKFQFAFNSLFAHLPHQYFASLVLCHDLQEQ